MNEPVSSVRSFGFATWTFYPTEKQNVSDSEIRSHCKKDVKN